MGAKPQRTYTVVITPDEEDGGFVGSCDELHAVSEGDTLAEVKRNMKEAVELAAEYTGFVGRCDELHANSQGDTLDEVKSNMKEVVELVAEEQGITDDFRIKYALE